MREKINMKTADIKRNFDILRSNSAPKWQLVVCQKSGTEDEAEEEG